MKQMSFKAELMSIINVEAFLALGLKKQNKNQLRSLLQETKLVLKKTIESTVHFSLNVAQSNEM